MTGSLFAASQRTVAPFRYDIVGSFLRSDALKEARKRFAQGRITQRELRQVEDAKIAQLVAKQKALGLRAVTDGEYRRNWWHLDFLWGLDGDSMIGQANDDPETSGINRLIGMQDFDGDKFADLLTVYNDGNLTAGSTASTAPERKVGFGWQTTAMLNSPGSFQKDTLSDLIGRRTDGNLYRYTNAGGKWDTAQRIGAGKCPQALRGGMRRQATCHPRAHPGCMVKFTSLHGCRLWIG